MNFSDDEIIFRARQAKAAGMSKPGMHGRVGSRLATAAGLFSITCSFHCSEGAAHDAVNNSWGLTCSLTCFGEHERNCLVRS